MMKLQFMKRSHTVSGDESLPEGCATSCLEARDSNPAGVKGRNRVSKLCVLTLMSSALMLGAGLSSCHHHDDREPVLPPKVEAAPNTLAGVVTNISGAPVQGATVTLGTASVKTDANGAYVFQNVAQGKYTVSAAADGMYTASSEVTFSKTSEQNLLWSVTLNRKTTQNLVVKDSGEDASGDVQSDNIPNNDEGAVTITVDVPANTVPDNTTITIAPIYSAQDATGTRADDETMLIGANVTCSDPDLQLTSPIDVVFNLDNSVVTDVKVREFDPATGRWRDVTPTVDGGKVTVKTTRFTSFGIFLPVTVTTTSSAEDIVFAQDLFDNRNGRDSMLVENASFTYKTGTAVNANAKNKLEGLLIEYLARMFGAKVTEMNGSYPLNITLAVGQGILLKGTQAVEAVRVASRNTAVTGTRYGSVTVTTSAFSVDHNGGVVGE